MSNFSKAPSIKKPVTAHDPLVCGITYHDSCPDCQRELRGQGYLNSNGVKQNGSPETH
jgi:hypothetical protein